VDHTDQTLLAPLWFPFVSVGFYSALRTSICELTALAIGAPLGDPALAYLPEMAKKGIFAGKSLPFTVQIGLNLLFSRLIEHDFWLERGCRCSFQ